MKTKTRVTASKVKTKNNETLVRDSGAGLKVKTQLGAGRAKYNHNETLLRDRA